ncbi:hypothetical protein A2961_04380 [Candidatus Woesebacteria bacterium RIFCSPLOWO2_01_FULL_39_21]|uniref:Uncharacterized protein n=1 Tax=Candidatus Woesebacteria bacterium RIFCSPLOWO2_01_FULL_39_21 TaxID=1802519 RepID=A0A1F8BK80_9BACT|nr:MAG: hypothetical protein A2691_01850 [Candidatus Woesebacteria bacterium RIFCSPHIGHO2_01_FULL_39_23]OGM64466.1 MAG: hypothetical protein A2961_04380 [Candidatus Woesebacteria bacterium RIFCSPLOWO2_01_FULL_39_21]
MKDLLTYIVEGITSSKDFSIDETTEESKYIYTIRIDPKLFGIIIGKEGKTIKAIRNLAKARAIIENKSVSVEVDKL